MLLAISYNGVNIGETESFHVSGFFVLADNVRWAGEAGEQFRLRLLSGERLAVSAREESVGGNRYDGEAFIYPEGPWRLRIGIYTVTRPVEDRN